jgi:hypothetical protein
MAIAILVRFAWPPEMPLDSCKLLDKLLQCKFNEHASSMSAFKAPRKL